MKPQRGVTLVEFGFVLVVAIGILLAVLAVASNTSGQSNQTMVAAQAVRFHNAVVQAYADQPSYLGITTAGMIARGALPADLVHRDSGGNAFVRSAVGMPIDIGGSHTYAGGGVYEADGTSYYAYVRGLDSQACAAVIRALQPHALYISAYNASAGSTMQVMSERGEVPLAATITTACASMAFTDVTYIAN